MLAAKQDCRAIKAFILLYQSLLSFGIGMKVSEYIFRASSVDFLYQQQVFYRRVLNIFQIFKSVKQGFHTLFSHSVDCK